MNVLIALGGGGGAILFVTVALGAIRAIVRQVDATDRNTSAIQKLTGKIEEQDQRLDDHDRKLDVLEFRTGGRS